MCDRSRSGGRRWAIPASVVALAVGLPGRALGAVPAAATQPPFWMSGTGRLVLSAACALLVAAAVLLTLRRPPSRAVRDRVESYVGRVVAEEAAEEEPAALELGSLAKRLARTNRWQAFVEAVEVSRTQRTPREYVRRGAGIGILLALLLILATGSVPLGVLPLLAWPFVLRAIVNRAAGRQRARFSETLPSYLQDLASAMRVGRSFSAALSIVAGAAEEPTRSELERAVTDESLGRPLEESLEAVARRMRSTDMDQVALVAGLSSSSGSNVTEALDRVADGARERNDLRRETKALTSQAKMSSSILTGLPAVVLIAICLISPKYAHPLFHTMIGIIALVVGAVMVAIGWKVMQRITRVEV